MQKTYSVWWVVLFGVAVVAALAYVFSDLLWI